MGVVSGKASENTTLYSFHKFLYTYIYMYWCNKQEDMAQIGHRTSVLFDSASIDTA